MRRASAEESFTWQPFDHGRHRRIAVLIAVGLSSALVGLAVGRASSGLSLESPRAGSPVLTTNGETAVATPISPPVLRHDPHKQTKAARIGNREASSLIPTPLLSPLQREHPVAASAMIAKKHGRSVPLPASPGIFLLNPSREKMAEGGWERTVRDEAHRERRGASGPRSTVAKKNDRSVPPVKAAPRMAQLAREPTRAYRAQDWNEPGRLKKPVVVGPKRPATFADYRALRDYMLRR